MFEGADLVGLAAVGAEALLDDELAGDLLLEGAERLGGLRGPSCCLVLARRAVSLIWKWSSRNAFFSSRTLLPRSCLPLICRAAVRSFSQTSRHLAMISSGTRFRKSPRRFSLPTFFTSSSISSSVLVDVLLAELDALD
jgi:hypothetical protein